MSFSALKVRPNSPTDTDIGQTDFLRFRNGYEYQFIPASFQNKVRKYYCGAFYKQCFTQFRRLYFDSLFGHQTPSVNRHKHINNDHSTNRQPARSHASYFPGAVTV
jgi:hypothetical protein